MGSRGKFRHHRLWPQNSVSRQQRQRQAETGSNAALLLGKALAVSSAKLEEWLRPRPGPQENVRWATRRTRQPRPRVRCQSSGTRRTPSCTMQARVLAPNPAGQPAPTTTANRHAATPTPSKGRLIRCTVLGSTPNRAAILRTLSPVSLRAFRAALMRRSISAAMRGRPSCAPIPGSSSQGSLDARTVSDRVK
jgi:hypothetical protein